MAQLQSFPNFTKLVGFAIVIAAIVYLFTNILKTTKSERRALLYTIIFFKIFVIMMVLFGFDTTLFHIVIYRKVGNATVVVNRIPVTAGMLALLSSLIALLVSLGVLEHFKNEFEHKISEVIE